MSLPTKADPRVVHYHPPVGLSTLFRPLPKLVAGKRPPLDVTYQPASGWPVLRFSAKASLGIPEQTLLLVLLELAREQLEAFARDVVVDASTSNIIGRELWSKLHIGGSGAGGSTLRLATTWHELNRRCASQTGGSARALREQQLERLCEVVVWQSDGDDRRTKRQSFLVVWLVGDDDRIHLALNCGLASALLGQPYAQVSLSERLALKRDIPMALHAFLSTTLRPGHTLKIGVEKLSERLWPGSAAIAPAGTHRRRRSDVLNGLTDLGRLQGWTVEWEREDLANVTRGSSSVRNMTSHKANKSRAYPEQAFAKIPNKINAVRAFDASGLFFNKNTSA